MRVESLDFLCLATVRSRASLARASGGIRGEILLYQDWIFGFISGFLDGFLSWILVDFHLFSPLQLEVQLGFGFG